MAKGKGKKGKKQEEQKVDPNAVTEVDKTFYELQITDLNRKLARLRELTANLEEKNAELEQKYVQLDEDRGDVIAYLKRQLSEKQNEANELQERLFALQDSKESEAIQYEQKIKDMAEEYRIMKEQLTSEIKLISGKLNALEEFRIHRDELMKKYVDQEKAIEEQEIRHKRTLYEAEKTYIMSKDTIKKDMEKRIIELAKEFQQANEIRIAATSHRIIRENIAINNEMDKLQEIIEKLTHENEDLKSKNKLLRQNCDLYTTERNMALEKSKIHRGVIDQLRSKYHELFTEVEHFKVEVQIAREKEKELDESKKLNDNLNYKIRVLEQNLHATQCETYAAKKLLCDAELKSEQLKTILFESVNAIEQSLKITINEEESEKYSKRESLLYYLLRLINEGHQEILRCESVDTIQSVKAAYIRGDLGFVPKSPVSRKHSPIKFHMDTQVGKSLQDLHRYEETENEPTVSEISLFGKYASETYITEYSKEEITLQTDKTESGESGLEKITKKSVKSLEAPFEFEEVTEEGLVEEYKYFGEEEQSLEAPYDEQEDQDNTV